MDSKQSIRVQRLLALLTIGVCDALQNGVVSIDEAEDLLFSPHSIRCCEEIGASARIIDMIHEGTELDAISRILSPAHLKASLDKMTLDARAFLRETESSDTQLDNWIEQIIRDVNP